MKTIPADKFRGRKIPGYAGITKYLSEYCNDEKSHRYAHRAIERAKRICGWAYAVLDNGDLAEIREFNGEVPAGWAEIEDRYELDGKRYYLNVTGSHYITMIDRDSDGRLTGYIHTIALRVTR